MALRLTLAVLLIVGIINHGNAASTCNKKIDERCVCGLQNKDDRTVDAKAFEFPWITAVVCKGQRAPNCTASIINNRYVLTTASCIQMGNFKAADIEILTHCHDIRKTDDEEDSMRYGVSEIIKHDKFKVSNEGGFTQYDNDLALLKLSKRIDFSLANSPIPICLPESNKHIDTTNLKLTLSGWGAGVEAQEATPRRVLKKTDPPVVSAEKCSSADYYGAMFKAVSDRAFCAGGEGSDSCGQDTGAPVFAKLPEMPNQYVALGIASWGEGCSRKNKPTVFPKLCQYVDWILDVSSCKDSAMWCKQKA